MSGSSNVDPVLQCGMSSRSTFRGAGTTVTLSGVVLCPVSCFCSGVLLVTLEMLTRESLSVPSCLVSPVFRFRCEFAAVNRFGGRAHPPADTVPVLTPEVFGL